MVQIKRHFKGRDQAQSARQTSPARSYRKIRLRRLVQDGRGEPEPPLVIEPAEPEPETATEPEAEPEPISNVGVFTPSRKERS